MEDNNMIRPEQEEAITSFWQVFRRLYGRNEALEALDTRRSVTDFSALMEMRLRENEYNWEEVPVNHLANSLNKAVVRLIEHVIAAADDYMGSKEASGNRRELIIQCADAANFAMMLAEVVSAEEENFGGLVRESMSLDPLRCCKFCGEELDFSLRGNDYEGFCHACNAITTHCDTAPTVGKRWLWICPECDGELAERPDKQKYYCPECDVHFILHTRQTGSHDSHDLGPFFR